MSLTRDSRLNAIRRILSQTEVGSQEIVVQQLTNLGFSVTQSSVSRDLADLAVQKVKGRYRLPLKTPASELGIHSASPAGPNLLVLRTQIGGAQLAASKIDQLAIRSIVGTVAGDDTIFVATVDGTGQHHVLEALGL